MEPVRIVVASSGFRSALDYFRTVLPKVGVEAEVEAVDPALLQQGTTRADVIIPAMAHFDGALMDCISGLRLIHQWGAGLEGVDIPAASQRGIAVANVPTAGSGNAESVAEWCVMAAIAISRCLPLLQEGIRECTTWGGPSGHALMGKTAGLVGLGGIGQALAARLQPFGLRRIAVKRQPDPALADRLGLDWLGGLEDLPYLLEQSDFLFLCLPLSEETRHLINAEALARLPDGACIINAGRGGLLDHDALLRELDTGRLGGAGLDVYEQEPLSPDSPLLGRSDILATPHVAGVTDLSYEGISRNVAENIRRLLAGEALRNCVNQNV
ncbi:2-hydroxyacid dehydrogenase [Fodinicurvata sediminis]|uniref:2-hydroxyacid dehydrogenase n=1 Tax=Fodinicurvata sediminis TaxID=1121832 RepID=UPI0003B3717B|nr:2-hydroxyacid dehydrogenase [Fodinicurvata sediminis]